MYVFRCEDSIDGIFTAVYDAWASRLGHKNIRISCAPCEDGTLFCEYIAVGADYEKSRKVSRTLLLRLEGLWRLSPVSLNTPNKNQITTGKVIAAMADGSCRSLSMDKANAVYQAIVMALALPQGAGVLDHLGEPCIACIFELCRQTSNEAHHLLEFLRFSELENGILFSRIHPKNDVLPILAAHFTDRLPLENFIIYDAVHKTAAVHKASKSYLIADASSIDPALFTKYSEDEARFRRLWCAFFDTIAVESRNNPKLQMQNIPKRFWADTVELYEKYYKSGSHLS